MKTKLYYVSFKPDFGAYQSVLASSFKDAVWEAIRQCKSTDDQFHVREV
jgi:hypothetical protein